MAEKLTSWGRYPAFVQTPHACNWRNDLPSLLNTLQKTYGTTLAFGNGRSYGDSCLAQSNQVLDTRALNRFIAVDWEKGIITAEAGLTLGELLEIAIPHGWFLPVTPGTKYVTLGGALANDVHGKNHHLRGTFGQFVQKFSLIRSDQPPITCSQQENKEFYAATIGGLGLTGIIEWIELKLLPIKSSQMNVTHIRFNTLSEFFALSSELDRHHEYSVAWIDCLAKGAAAGRGIYTVGNHANDGILKISKQNKLSIPFTPPVSIINNLSLRIFNSIYYHSQAKQQQNKILGYERFFYPLDRILYWNRIYGPYGFQQYQCVIPEDAAPSAIKELLASIANMGMGSFLAVLKRCGSITSPGLLSFPMAGTSLALDFPQKKTLATQLFPRLDTIVRQAGGRLYPAKDAHMSSKDFQHFYPAWQQVEKLRDPALSSHFWERVTL